MSKLTITEALQEIKTINSRIAKKRQSLLGGGFLARDVRVRDLFENDGGSEAYIKAERQSIADLESRIITIRVAIQFSNLNSSLMVGDETKTVAEWLTWRREVSGGQRQFLNDMVNAIRATRNQVQKSGGKIVAAASNVAINEMSQTDPPQVIVNVDEKDLIAQTESIETKLGTLDGKLSLFNATTVVDV